MSSPDLDLEKRLGALRELIRTLFDAEQLRRFLITLPAGDRLADELPGVHASFAALYHEATVLLHRWRLVDGELFNALVRARPTARAEIERVAALWSLGVTTQVRARGAPAIVGADDKTERAANELRDLRNKLNVVRSKGLPTASLEATIREKTRALTAGPVVHAGDTLADGRYLVVEKLGSGGFATVWRAWDEERQREVAIKVLHGETVRESSRLDRFRRGAGLMAELVHPHIVRLYDVPQTEGGLHYVVMELLPGGDLHQRVLAGTLDRAAALTAVLGVGEALAFAHSKGIVHRDVKPHNILLDEGGGAKLTDFDLGRADEGTRDTRTSSSMGTLMYAAPEALENARDVGPEGDVASLAMTAAFCIYGADLPKESLYQRDRFFAGLDCSKALRAVLVKGSAHRPQDRYPSAQAFTDALRAALPTPASPRPSQAVSPAPGASPKRRSFLFVALAGAALLGLMGFGIAAALQYKRRPLAQYQEVLQNPANGHRYMVVPPVGTSWDEAKAAAEAMSLGAQAGHLVTITSEAEQDWLEDNFELDYLWLGGFQDDAESVYPEPIGGWRWVTGEPFAYTHWADGEPNDTQRTSNWLSTVAGGGWNDNLRDWSYNPGSNGFLVEFE